MARLLNLSHAPRHLLGMALLVASPLLGQSSPATKTPTLQVRSADYVPETDSIRFKLVNHSDRAATAYAVVFGLTNDANQVNGGPGFGEDLLNLALISQCRNAGRDVPGDNSNSWEGAIKPGDTYVKSIPANLDKSQLNGAAPIIHAEVTGIIWSDGSVQEVPNSPAATASIDAALRSRKKDASDTAKVVDILNAHPDDPDIQHRIWEAIRSLHALTPDSPQVELTPKGPPPEPRHLVPLSPTVSSALSNLSLFAASANPKDAFEAYRALLECQSERRTALQQSAPPVTAGQ